MRLCALPTLFILAILVVPLESVRAQGGPPELTDDPDTPGSGHWEINFGMTFERTARETSLETPRVDFNYGWGSRIQLKYELPWVVLLPKAGPARSGLGNSLVGVKWRFMDEEHRGLSISTYPQLEFDNPTSSSDRGVVDRGTQFLLPVEMSRRLGPLRASWEVGYQFRQHQSDRWIYGFVASRGFAKRLEWLGEIHGTAHRRFRGNALVFDLGGRWHLTERLVLLFTTGHAIHGPHTENPMWFGYIGTQLLL